MLLLGLLLGLLVMLFLVWWLWQRLGWQLNRRRDGGGTTTPLISSFRNWNLFRRWLCEC
jgi:hypothetical protein